MGEERQVRLYVYENRIVLYHDDVDIADIRLEPSTVSHNNFIEGVNGLVFSTEADIEREDNFKIALIDIDGVCFDCTDRLTRNGVVPYHPIDDTIDKRRESKPNWKAIFSNAEVIRDPMIENANVNVQEIAKHYQPVYLTGRSITCHSGTSFQLSANGFPDGALYMRSEHDYRPDFEVKEEWITKIDAMFGIEVAVAVDDDWNGKLTPMYKRLGFKVYHTLADLMEAINNGNVSEREIGNLSDE